MRNIPSGAKGNSFFFLFRSLGIASSDASMRHLSERMEYGGWRWNSLSAFDLALGLVLPVLYTPSLRESNFARTRIKTTRITLSPFGS